MNFFKTCPNCYYVHPNAKRQCEFCGWVFYAKKDKSK